MLTVFHQEITGWFHKAWSSTSSLLSKKKKKGSKEVTAVRGTLSFPRFRGIRDQVIHQGKNRLALGNINIKFFMFSNPCFVLILKSEATES